MDEEQIDEAVSTVERYLYQSAPKGVYQAWGIVVDAANRYSELLD